MVPQAIRLRFRKTGKLKFISHLDLSRTMRHAFLRSEIPIWYSQGFNPHAKLVFALPLSVGTESQCEFLDIKLNTPMDCEEIRIRLNQNLTDELYIEEVYPPITKFSEIFWSEYELILETDKNVTEIEKVFQSPVILKKRSKSGEKEVDITPFIHTLRAESYKGKIKIQAILMASNENYLNPEYIGKALGCDDVDSIMRINIYKEDAVTLFR